MQQSSTTVENAEIIEFLEAVWGPLSGEKRLFPMGPGWNAILKHLCVAPEHRLTPGSFTCRGCSLPAPFWFESQRRAVANAITASADAVLLPSRGHCFQYSSISFSQCQK